ncbi:MAG: DNA phosphorothioation-dependent restriction protein DptG [bacterium]
MEYYNNIKKLKESLAIKDEKIGLKHNINNKAPLLPFKTNKNADFDKGFNSLLGELSRLISNNILDKEVEESTIIKSISENVDMNKSDKVTFERLMEKFLFDQDNTIKVFHPHMFQYFKTKGKKEEDIALFIRDIFFNDVSDDLRSFFSKKNKNHILSKLVLSKLSYLKSESKATVYINKLSTISDIFYDDLTFLLNHKKYFMDNLDIFIAYYYFFYTLQLSLKLDKINEGDLTSIEKVYYTLDWERTSRSRKSYIRGYNFIRNIARTSLFAHINCLEHLNFLFDTSGASYKELNDLFISKSDEEKKELIKFLKIWIREYRKHRSLEAIEHISNDYNQIIKILFESLKAGIPDAAKTRYAYPIEAIGKKYFLKTRGSLGYMLNITQDFLLFLTAVAVKNERKALKSVFEEYEKRGVYFDRYSKEAVVLLLDKLNILDKKSDSGDAQYVKPIL